MKKSGIFGPPTYIPCHVNVVCKWTLNTLGGKFKLFQIQIPLWKGTFMNLKNARLQMISTHCLCTLGAASVLCFATELKDVFLLSNDSVTLKSVIAQLWQKRRIYGTKKDVWQPSFYNHIFLFVQVLMDYYRREKIHFSA